LPIQWAGNLIETIQIFAQPTPEIQVVAAFPEKSQHKSYTVLSGIEHYIFYSVKFTNRLSGKLPTIFVHLSSGKLVNNLRFTNELSRSLASPMSYLDVLYI
jgi:hypothetical protein